MFKNLTPQTLHLLTRKELPYSLEFLSYHKFEATETKEETHLDNLQFVTFEKTFGDLSVIITYTFDLNISEDLFEKTVELKICDEYVSLDFPSKLDLYNLVYCLQIGREKPMRTNEKGTVKQEQA